MTLNKPNYHNHLYLFIAVIGATMMVSTIWMANDKISDFETNASRIFRMMAIVNIELETLETESSNMELSLQDLEVQASGTLIQNEKESLNNSLQQLQSQMSSLYQDIEEKKELASAMQVLKSETLSNITVLFWMTLGMFSLGILLFIVGSFALATRLEVFQDRRKKPREKDYAGQTDGNSK